MQKHNKKLARLLLPVVVGAACMMAASIVAYATMALASATPHVGDIVAFSPLTTSSSEEAIRLLVHRQDETNCVIDLTMVRHSSSSLIVETEMADKTGSFGIHWAGGRTSADAGDCGSNVDLIVDYRDLDVLALAAGGYGIGPKLVSSFVHDMTDQ